MELGIFETLGLDTCSLPVSVHKCHLNGRTDRLIAVTD